MRVLLLILSLLISTAVNADVKGQALSKASEKISSTIGNLIPGEGVTEVSVEIREEDNPDFEILGVRDILSKENSNLFTQFSIHNNEVNGDNRYIGNLGLGYRFLNSDKSMMFGANSFYDKDIQEDHSRISLGFEAKASILDFTLNKYQKTTNMKVVNGDEEQALSGLEYNLSSQVPYVPWTVFNYQGYKWESEKAAQDTKGSVYSLEMAINPSLQFDLSRDVSSVDGVDDVDIAKLTFVYPPRENKPTLQDGLVSNAAFEKKNMKEKLKEKVRRNNNIIIEVQGSVIVTSQ
ncbi:inverse autotransporter beta domain-containing protein [Candidatus Pelagibacter sp.]|jgi:hypothetical protein|nr:inverse autotransporter beta domain-containing protein [Candidatus Pelagibacter bacterium]MDC0448454.1 inverse autotransporter beta domain-containing protein [Candidatus Pelagibacter sp.]